MKMLQNKPGRVKNILSIALFSMQHNYIDAG